MLVIIRYAVLFSKDIVKNIILIVTNIICNEIISIYVVKDRYYIVMNISYVVLIMNYVIYNMSYVEYIKPLKKDGE